MPWWQDEIENNHRYILETEQVSLKKRWIFKDTKRVKNNKRFVGGSKRWDFAPLAGGSGTLASAAATCKLICVNNYGKIWILRIIIL